MGGAIGSIEELHIVNEQELVDDVAGNWQVCLAASSLQVYCL